MITFHRDTVEVLEAAIVTDRYGNESLDWSDPTVTSVDGCRVLPVPGDELLDRVTTRLVLYAPAGTPLTPASRVRAGSVTYDVTGEVRFWPSPSGALAHIEADLSRVEG